MILNLAPVKSFHLDTLSSLNFANRTKKIEVREIENEPVIKGCHRAVPTLAGTSIQRQPLRPLATTLHNAAIHASNPNPNAKPGETRLTKAFSVYSDKARHSNATTRPQRMEVPHRSSPLKRPSEFFSTHASRPPKRRSPDRMLPRPEPALSKAALEDMIERKVTDILATRALDQPSTGPPIPEISEQVQRRLELLEQKIEGKDDEREQGLTFLLMAKQHAVRGENGSALRMYELAREYFPGNAKLDGKIKKLREKITSKKEEQDRQDKQQQDKRHPEVKQPRPQSIGKDVPRKTTQRLTSTSEDDDDSQNPPEPLSDADYESTSGFRHSKPKRASKTKLAVKVLRNPSSHDDLADESTDSRESNPKSALIQVHKRDLTISDTETPTPRTTRLLSIINTRDIAQIRLLKGVGAKKAEAILEAMCADDCDGDEGEREREIRNLEQLGRMKGVGARTVENMRSGLSLAL